MNRLMAAVAVAGTTLLAACGSGEVVVQAQLENDQGQIQPLGELPVRALPYDRDLIFDSLRAAYDTPEPEVPADLSALQDSISAAQSEWTSALARWNTGRDSLRVLNEAMQRLNPAMPQYIVLYNQSSTLRTQVDAAERTSNAAFQRFDQLNKSYLSRAEETRRARAAWADVAYADVDDAIAARLKETGRGEVADTTDANGMALLGGLKKGTWWIHARHDLPFEELYWNVQVEVGGDPVQVQLTRQNAQVRPKL